MKDVYTIAKRASRHLDFSNCYLITLFYYLVDEKDYPIEYVPAKIQPAVKILSRKLNRCSFLHYLTVIDMSENPYVKRIKDETILLKGIKNEW